MPSAVARRGFLVEGAEAAFLVGTILSGLAVGFGGRCSSTAGGPSSHRMIASRPGWSCFFSPAVSSASTSGLAYSRPVELAAPERGRSPIDNQAHQEGPDVLQHPFGCDRRDTQFAELGYFSLKMT